MNLKTSGTTETQAKSPRICIGCPHCGHRRFVSYESLGTEMLCGSCNRVFSAARSAIAIDDVHANTSPNSAIMSSVAISLLGTCLGTLLWMLLCFPMALLPFSLAMAEAVFLFQVGKMSRRDAHSQSTLLGIFEIAMGVLTPLNPFNIIGGIMTVAISTKD